MTASYLIAYYILESCLLLLNSESNYRYYQSIQTSSSSILYTGLNVHSIFDRLMYNNHPHIKTAFKMTFFILVLTRVHTDLSYLSNLVVSRPI